MKRYAGFLLFAAALLCTAMVQAQARPETAEQLLRASFAKAGRNGKNVFAMFGASWCVWCKMMDSAINDAACRDFFNRSYEFVHLTVYETGPNKHLENPGAVEYLNKFLPADQGIPFWLVLDKDGKVLADANYRPGENSGCPAKPEEVAYFINVLRKTSSLTAAEAAAIQSRFLRNQ